MNTHTPGPWGCISTSNHAHDYRLTRLDGSTLPLNDDAKFENGNDHREQRANARLISAAPDLLEALREYVERQEAESINCNGLPEYDKAIAAIKKASGK